MREHFRIALRMTIATTVLLGVAYPLLVTGIAQVCFPAQANGSLLRHTGRIVGSRLIGQPFSGEAYFHSRLSAAGDGYDAGNSGGSNLGPTNARLVARIRADVARRQAENPNAAVPVDLVTASGSGLDPDISPAAAYFQVPRVARARHISEERLHSLVAAHIVPRQYGLLGEPRVNVLELNLALDALAAAASNR